MPHDLLPDTSPADRRRRWWLVAILAVGLGLRVFRLSWGLPDFVPPDSLNYYIRPAARLVAAGELVPPSFVHTPLFVYTIALVDFVWSHTLGEPIDLSPRPLQKGLGGLMASGGRGLLGTQGLPPQLTTLILVSRAFCVLTAMLSVVVLYFLARRLVGVRAALFASAIFALAPLHVLESHRVNADGLMILLALLTAHRAAAAAQEGSRRGLFAAFALAGVTGAIRYNGLAIASVPAWAAIRWPDASMPERVRLLVGGVAIVAAVLGIGLLPALFDLETFRNVMVSLLSGGFVTGGNLDLSGDGWVYNRYVYQLVLLLPFSMGWPAYLASLVGVVVLAKRSSISFGLVLAAIAPFFVVQGAALAVEPRYYQLLIPFLALTAGVTLDAIVARRERLGIAVAVLVLGYTAILAASHCARLGLGPQRAVVDLLHARARSAAADGRTLGVGYPGPVDILFDPLRTQVRDPTIRLLHMPHVGVLPTADSEEVLSDAQLVETLRQWAASKEVDVVVVPSWQEGIAERTGRTDSEAVRVFRFLADGTLPFRQAAHFRDGFFTERLYTWADPLLNGHRATGILGYKVFLKTADE